MSEGGIKRVLVVFAMEAESTPLIQALQLKEDDPPRLAGPAPCRTFSGMHAGAEVHVVWNGKCSETGVDNVGTVPASLSTYLAVLAFKPDIVISAGTAGGFKSQGAAIGDVFVSTAVINHDRRIPLPNFDKYGLGYSTSPATPKLQAALALKQGVVSSGNSLDYTEQCMKIMASHNVAVKEMEAAAIAWVCAMYRTPLLCVKSITDIVDGGRATADEFLENLTSAAASLQKALPQVIHFMCGKQLADL